MPGDERDQPDGLKPAGARTFQRGGSDPQNALDTNTGAGHSAANSSLNFGGGMGGTQNARIH